MATVWNNRPFITLAVLTGCLLLITDVTRVESQGEQEQRFEISIQNSKFVLKEPAKLQRGVPTVLILRNQDIIRHGFTSPQLTGMRVDGEAGGMAVYGKGIEGFYVDPWKTLVLRFTPTQPGRYEFFCDIHPGMKEEIFLLEMNTA